MIRPVLTELVLFLAPFVVYAIFLVASLGFLGVGVQPPSPDWGLMVNENRNYLTLTPWATAAALRIRMS